MNTISNVLPHIPVAAKEKEKVQDTTPSPAVSFTPSDTVSLSSEALALSAESIDTASKAVETAKDSRKQEADEIQWGPDLLEGWDDPDYLRMVDGGFVGSLSMTTAKGTKVGIAAETTEDGSPSSSVIVSIQGADGTLQQYRVEQPTSTYTEESPNKYVFEHTGGFLRITENEDGIEVSTQPSYTDGDDIIVVMGGGGGYGGDGNDTLISLGGTDLRGGDGDDTLVAIAPVQQHEGGFTGGSFVDSMDPDRTNSVDGGNGNDTILVRDYQSGGIFTGSGNNRIVIDHMHKNSILHMDQKAQGVNFDASDITRNSFDIRLLEGMFFADNTRGKHHLTMRIGEVRDAYMSISGGGTYDTSASLVKDSEIVAFNGAQGSMRINTAENSLFYGSGISVKNDVNSLVTNDEGIYIFARNFGISFAKRMLEEGLVNKPKRGVLDKTA